MFGRISKKKIQKALFSILLFQLVLIIIHLLILSLELWIYTGLGISSLLGNMWMKFFLFLLMFTLPFFVVGCSAPYVLNIMAPKMKNPPEKVEASLRMIAKKTGARVRWITFIDRPVKNALAAGLWWPGYGVFFFRGLTTKLSKEELIAVGAHEIGHARHNHVAKNLLNFIFFILLAIFLTIVFIFVVEGLGYTTVLQPIVILVVQGVFFVPLFLIYRRFYRRREMEADLFAKDQGKGEALASALKRISPKKTTMVHRLMSILLPHPSLKERERALRSRVD